MPTRLPPSDREPPPCCAQRDSTFFTVICSFSSWREFDGGGTFFATEPLLTFNRTGLLLKPAIGTCIAYDGSLPHSAHPVQGGLRVTVVFYLKRRVQDSPIGSPMEQPSTDDAASGEGLGSGVDVGTPAGEGGVAGPLAPAVAPLELSAAPAHLRAAWRLMTTTEMARGGTGLPLSDALVRRANFSLVPSKPKGRKKKPRANGQPAGQKAEL